MDFLCRIAAKQPAALEAFLDSLIDYAGLFPPARLPLGSALKEYATHLAEPELSRYLGCFVIPVELLPEASAWVRQRGGQAPARPRFSVLAGPQDECGAIAAAVREFETSSPNARVEMLELKTAATAADGYAGISPMLDAMEAAFRGNGSPRGIFVEIDWRSDPSTPMALLAERKGVGVKLRSGGLTPDLVPPPAAVARFLQAAARFRLAVKFTAGLHVPAPNDDPAVGARMHGFLNVMAAAMAYRSPTSTEELAQILEQLSYVDFSFDEGGFQAGALWFDGNEIRLLRQHVRGFGSCSFREPLEHLAAHGLLAVSPRNHESLAQ